MNERRQEKNIREDLQHQDIQERILQGIQEARANATVTISQAASLFSFTENQLREWERRGLLQTERSLREKEGKETGHRRYAPQVLDKLAIIRELLAQGYTPGEIPQDVDQIWTEVIGAQTTRQSGQYDLWKDARPHPEQANPAPSVFNERQEAQLPIDQRVEENDRWEFWRYFVSQALRISLLLICQDIPDTLAGLILPLEDRRLASAIQSPENLHQVGPSLVGWLEVNRSFHTFLEHAPTFEFASDFRLERLKPSYGQTSSPDRVLDNVLIVLQRKTRPLSLSGELVEAVRRVLSLVYLRAGTWIPKFDRGMRDWLYQIHDLERASSLEGDRIVNSLLERVIELGGKTDTGRNRWSFCTLLLPNDFNLPVQQQTLVARAQTRHSPYEIGMTVSNPSVSDSVSLKAFQSGQIFSLAEALSGQSMTTYRLPDIFGGLSAFLDAPGDFPEASTRSALAIPVAGESGVSAAVIYIASEEAQAFSVDDQRALRILGRMVEELLSTSRASRQIAGKLSDLINRPSVVDVSFQQFASEADFVAELVSLLSKIQQRTLLDTDSTENLSVISIDIDRQSSIGVTYGNRVARNLSQEVGARISRQIPVSDRYASGRLFHVSADKYFLLVRISLEETRTLARQLKEILQGDYLLKPLYATPGRPVSPGEMLAIAGITFHLGVSSYAYEKLAELLERYPVDTAVRRVSDLIIGGVEQTLSEGKSGDCIITWSENKDTGGWGYIESS